MFHKENPDYNRRQVGFYALEELVPEDHFLRQVDTVIDFSFIYDLVEDTYCLDNGRPSLDPVLLVKIPLLQCFYGIHSMRQTIKDIQVNVAYRWFLGLSLDDRVPHFTTYGKNYTRRFKEKAVIEHIFSHVLNQAITAGLVDPSEIFVDGTHIKAAANNRKYQNQVVAHQAAFMSEQLAVEIEQDRKKHAKKSLKPAKESKPDPKKVSTTDPESGWFHKGDHKQVFAYATQVACDQHGWALAYTVEAGNSHDSQAFPALFAKIEPFNPQVIIADSGYKNPSIAKFLLDKAITPLFPYTRPRGKKGMLRPNAFVYDAYYDCYLCPENQVLPYRTTNREGYREYKSDPKHCQTCPLLSLCTQNKDYQKTVSRHIWKDYLEICEDIRHQSGMKELYQKRKETIERLFGTAKEYHNLRYTRERGKSKMEDKVGLTLACLNIKKLVKRLAGRPFYFAQNRAISQMFSIRAHVLFKTQEKTNLKMKFVFGLRGSYEPQ